MAWQTGTNGVLGNERFFIRRKDKCFEITFKSTRSRQEKLRRNVSCNWSFDVHCISCSLLLLDWKTNEKTYGHSLGSHVPVGTAHQPVAGNRRLNNDRYMCDDSTILIIFILFCLQGQDAWKANVTETSSLFNLVTIVGGGLHVSSY